MEEYLIHGVRYAFPGKRGRLARGIPTAQAAPPLAIQITSRDRIGVWPDSEGKTKTYALEVLYRSVPVAAISAPKLHELLALVDILRVGRAREGKMAGMEEALEICQRRLNRCRESPSDLSRQAYRLRGRQSACSWITLRLRCRLIVKDAALPCFLATHPCPHIGSLARPYLRAIIRAAGG